MDAEPIASTLEGSGDTLDDLVQLVEAAENRPDLQTRSVERIGNALHAVILQPVLAPEPIAWTAVGFLLGDDIARQLGDSSRLDVAFRMGDLVGGTTLAPGLARVLPHPRENEVIEWRHLGEDYLALSQGFPGDWRGRATMTVLRSLRLELAPFVRLERGLVAVTLIALAIALAAGVVLANSVSRPVGRLAQGAGHIARGDYQHRVSGGGGRELNELADAFNSMALGLEERDKVRDLLGKAVSPEIARELLQSDLGLGGAEREVTVLFTDLRGFTALAEGQRPSEMVAQLNEYFGMVTGAIESNGGVVDKFVGDSVMALFGAPLRNENHAECALEAALAVCRGEDELNSKRAEEGLPPFKTGIGINSGVVIAGNIGAPTRHNYTVIGDEVNIASRLEGLTKVPDHNARVILSDSTRRSTRRIFNLRPLGLTPIRGRAAPLTIWALEADALR